MDQVNIDSVMIMVEMYSALPQSKYQGKYPLSMVSPQEIKDTTSPHNGENITQAGQVKKDQVHTETQLENGSVTTKEETESVKNTASPMIKVSPPERGRRSISPPRRDRGRSPRRGIDSYRPRSPGAVRPAG